ncbi:MAG: FliH/SctL family protein [Leptospirales bacterium]
MAKGRDGGEDGGFSGGFRDLFTPSGKVSQAGRSMVREEVAVDLEEDGLSHSAWLRSIEEKAREEGRKEGYAEGLDQGLRDAQEIRLALTAWADSLPDLLSEELQGRLDRLSGIVVSALGHLLSETLERPEGVRSLVERLIRDWAGGQEMDLWLSPEMHSFLGEHLPDWFGELRGRKIDPVASPTLSGVQISLHIREKVVSFDPCEAIRKLEVRLREGGAP